MWASPKRKNLPLSLTILAPWALTSWERNDNTYYTATSLKGPWTLRGNFAPKGSLTWNSQTTFVLPIKGSKGTTYMFMGDRWSYPKQASAATYVWQPITISGYHISIPKFQEAWQINTNTGLASPSVIGGKKIENSQTKLIRYSGNWSHAGSDSLSVSSSDQKDAFFSLKFRGRQIAMYGQAGPKGGYAQLTLVNSKGKSYCQPSLTIIPCTPRQHFNL